MQGPKKKSMIAAAAAPFALTLALGAPAYANGKANEAGKPNEQASTNANSSSEAEISVSGCTVNSDKDISYIQYLDGEAEVYKDETVGTESATLSTDLEYTTVVVKAGTTVETFHVTCSLPETTVPTTEEKTEDETKPEDETRTEDETKPKDETKPQDETETEGGDEIDEDKNVGGGRDNGNNNRGGNDNDAVAGAEASAGGNGSAGAEGNAAAGAPEAGGDAVLGAEADAEAYQPIAADGSTQYLPNTGAEENAALIAGGAGLAGLGAWMMLKRRRFGLER